MPLDPEDVRAALADALANAVPGELCTRWVTIIETLDEQGDRCLWLMAPTGQKAWESLGMLRYAEHLEQAATVAARLVEDPDT